MFPLTRVPFCVCVCGTAWVHSANSIQHPPQDKPGVQGWDPAQRKHACASWQGRPPRNQYKYTLPNLEPHELVGPATRTRADESTRAGIRARRRDILASEATQKGSSPHRSLTAVLGAETCSLQRGNLEASQSYVPHAHAPAANERDLLHQPHRQRSPL